jgi:hypothetical protein
MSTKVSTLPSPSSTGYHGLGRLGSLPSKPSPCPIPFLTAQHEGERGAKADRAPDASTRGLDVATPSRGFTSSQLHRLLPITTPELSKPRDEGESSGYSFPSQPRRRPRRRRPSPSPWSCGRLFSYVLLPPQDADSIPFNPSLYCAVVWWECDLSRGSSGARTVHRRHDLVAIPAAMEQIQPSHRATIVVSSPRPKNP